VSLATSVQVLKCCVEVAAHEYRNSPHKGCLIMEVFEVHKALGV
jgi:hypothetical protein